MPSRQILGSNCRKDQMSFSLTNSVVLSMLGCYRYNVAQTTKLSTHMNNTRYLKYRVFYYIEVNVMCYMLIVLQFEIQNVRNTCSQC